MTQLLDLLGEPETRRNPTVWESVKQSKVMALGWTAMRVWLGVMWIQAGKDKIWGSESAGFLHHGGPAVKGFALHGTPAYSWWGSFLHHFVVPNAGWIGVLIAVGELAVGIALVAGAFTRLAALGSLLMLFTYVMSGTASVCAFYALFAVVILTMWRTASWIGVDGLVANWRHHHPGRHLHVLRRRGVTGAVGTPHPAV